MDRFSIALDSEYHECFNACRRCGEEICECPQPCPHDMHIKCSKVRSCEEPCWDDDEDDLED